MVFDKFQKIKESYYCLKDADELSDEKYEELRTEYNKLGIVVPELEKLHAEKTIAYVFTDPECEDATVIILNDDGNGQSYVSRIKDGVEEYYSCSSFHNEITGFAIKDLILLATDESNIPIVAYYEYADMMSVRWLRSICE